MSGRITGVEISIDGSPFTIGSFLIEQEWIDITTMIALKPDPDWTFVDASGHFHAWSPEGDSFPTLISKTREPEPESETEHDYEYSLSLVSDDLDDFYDDDDDVYVETYRACRICDAEVEPKYISVDPHKTVPGRIRWTVEVDQDQAVGKLVSVVANLPGKMMFGVGVVDSLQEMGGGYSRSRIVDYGFAGYRPIPVERKAKAA